MRKTYLADLKSKGYSVAELKIIPEKSEFNFGKIIEEFGSETSVVVKPSVSGGARNTIRCKAGELKKEETLLQTILSESDLIIQPYFPEIADEGEYSFFYFGGKYSHAIVKKPAKGDFRAHQLFGAKNLKYEPNREEIAEVAKFTLARGEPMPYARVDVFRRNQKFLLVELELIEPYLYFEHAPVSALDDFCKAILA